ncbi:sigma-54-dependent Fis family transcriptional regulator [Mesoterricola silvestris]|uniref:Sigma-54-dependent Fis family transcriptional regulator n=1 Tax=Mesoterricola silvestris TaxID=2927979 RepID=A0AA48K863_9BACT|nr:sigma-54-dependent Fis family transcriptional regulator [Mesoterricola silvestris]BDU71916.1 sigma-54-dependent Fis family transcriptional regulator [Mesoterricola silvestris]
MGFRKINTPGILSAWEQFVSTGDLEPGVLAPEVEASWRRCLEAGVDPFAGRAPGVLRPTLFAELRERKQDLIRVARPFMDNLFGLVAGSFVVLLFDEHGVLLETVGDPERIRTCQDLNLNGGALWDEHEVGTNGAGTSLILGRPFQVSGPEHFCRKHHRWTCSGAPILDPEGRAIGLLDLSGPVDETHSHTLGLVMAAVAAIQNALILGQRNQELTLLNDRLSRVLGTVTDGVVVVDAQGVIGQINPAAERILAIPGARAEGRSIRDLVLDPEPVAALLERGQEFLDRELDVQSGPGVQHCLASGKPILGGGGAVRGAVLFVNPINKLKRLVNRFSGAQATFRFEDILGQGQALVRAVQLGRAAAENESNVLLTGESGTGKEMFAQSIHNQSSRRKGPFVAVNCGAIPRELIASELFGYQDGAFTGAARGGRPGKFELAGGGTLFLDEIGDMPLEQQVALLRVLQDRAITRLGGDRAFLVDVRIICATHKDLREEARRGTFRQDLYYRLNVSMIKLPPLREHPEDVPVLLQAFLARRGNRAALDVDPAAVAALQAYPWPGNIREFQNVVERMALSVQGSRITLEHLPEELLRSPEALPPPPPAVASGPLKLRDLLAEEEREEILASLRSAKGNMTRAAQNLGISRNTLYRKMEKFGL